MDNSIDTVSAEPQWWETFDGVLLKLEELYKENLELKEKICMLKTVKKPRKPRTKKT